MFNYKTLVSSVVAVLIASPVFAADQAASSVASGMQLASATNASSMQDMSATMQEKVNVNKATMKDLMKVKGMSAAKAKAIMAYRKKNGDFKSMDDLKNVKGFAKMKATKMQKMMNQMSVE